MVKRIKINPNDSKAQIKQEILSTYTLDEILELLIDYATEDTANSYSPIIVTADEYLKITRLFRVRGYKAGQDPNTEGVERERRGRKKKSPEAELFNYLAEAVSKEAQEEEN